LKRSILPDVHLVLRAGGKEAGPGAPDRRVHLLLAARVMRAAQLGLLREGENPE
jgi:hypothetical protein